MSEWQPIETAPKDGSEFLAYDVVGGKFNVCVWTKGGPRLCELGRLPGDTDPYEFAFDRALANATLRYWMPLPEPPKTGA